MNSKTYNEDCEESVVGSVMLSHPAARYCQQVGLTSKNFGNLTLGKIYGVVLACYEAGKTTDPVVVMDELDRLGVLEEVGDKPFISRLLDTTPNPHNIKHYVEIVMRDSTTRRQDKLACMVQDAIRIGANPSEQIALLHETLNASGGRHRLQTITAFDLQTKEFSPLTYVVDKLLPAGLCFFAGAFKSGKSWMTLQLALAVARGDTFFGEQTTQGDVLVVAAEDNERRLKTRIANLCKCGWPDTLHLATSIPRLDTGGIEELERFKRDHSELRLVVLDVWQRVRGKERSRNMYADDYNALETIQNFASENDIAVLVVHHHRKAGDDDPFNKFSGSTGLGGGTDTMWSLERERGQCEASFITTGRDILEMELALNFNEETCEWIALGPLGEYAQSRERSEIIRVLNDEEGRAMSPKEITEAAGKNSVSTTRNLLKKMLKAGIVEKAGYGEYVSKEMATSVDFKGSNDEEV